MKKLKITGSLTLFCKIPTTQMIFLVVCGFKG